MIDMNMIRGLNPWMNLVKHFVHTDTKNTDGKGFSLDITPIDDQC